MEKLRRRTHDDKTAQQLEQQEATATLRMEEQMGEAVYRSPRAVYPVGDGDTAEHCLKQ